MHRYESDPGQTTLKDAFDNVGKKAGNDKNKGNHDAWFAATIMVQVTENPGIKEYKVEIKR